MYEVCMLTSTWNGCGDVSCTVSVQVLQGLRHIPQLYQGLGSIDLPQELEPTQQFGHPQQLASVGECRERIP